MHAHIGITVSYSAKQWQRIFFNCFVSLPTFTGSENLIKAFLTVSTYYIMLKFKMAATVDAIILTWL